MTATDNPIHRGLFVVTDPGTEAASLAVPFLTAEEPATEPEAPVHSPGAAAVLAALDEHRREWKTAHAALVDAVLCLGHDVSALSDRFRHALNGDDEAGPV